MTNHVIHITNPAHTWVSVNFLFKTTEIAYFVCTLVTTTYVNYVLRSNPRRLIKHNHKGTNLSFPARCINSIPQVHATINSCKHSHKNQQLCQKGACVCVFWCFTSACIMKSNQKACQSWSSCHHWPSLWMKRSSLKGREALLLRTSQQWKGQV